MADNIIETALKFSAQEQGLQDIINKLGDLAAAAQKVSSLDLSLSTKELPFGIEHTIKNIAKLKNIETQAIAGGKQVIFTTPQGRITKEQVAQELRAIGINVPRKFTTKEISNLLARTIEEEQQILLNASISTQRTIAEAITNSIIDLQKTLAQRATIGTEAQIGILEEQEKTRLEKQLRKREVQEKLIAQAAEVASKESLAEIQQKRQAGFQEPYMEEIYRRAEEITLKRQREEAKEKERQQREAAREAAQHQREAERQQRQAEREAAQKQREAARIAAQLQREQLQLQRQAEREARATPFAIQRGAFAKSIAFAYSGAVIYEIINFARGAIQSIQAMEDGLVELRKVMNDVTADFNQMKQAALGFAKEYGQNIQDVMGIMVEFARQGRSQAEVIEMSRVALLAMNIAEMEGRDAASKFNAIQKQLRLETSELIKVLDIFNELSNRNAVTAADLATAVSLIGASFQTTGREGKTGLDALRELSALITGMITVTGEAAPRIGRSLRSGFQRIIAPESAQVLEAQGIAVKKSKTEYRDLFDIITEIANKWETFNDIQRKAIVMAIGGRDHYARWEAMLSRFDIVTKALNETLTATGSSIRENDARMNSWTKGLEQMKAAVAELQIAIGESGLLGVLKALTNTLGLAIKGLTAIFGTPGVGSLMTLGGGVAVGGIGLLNVMNVLGMTQAIGSIRTYLANWGRISASNRIGGAIVAPFRAMGALEAGGLAGVGFAAAAGISGRAAIIGLLKSLGIWGAIVGGIMGIANWFYQRGTFGDIGLGKERSFERQKKALEILDALAQINEINYIDIANKFDVLGQTVDEVSRALRQKLIIALEQIPTFGRPMEGRYGLDVSKGFRSTLSDWYETLKAKMGRNEFYAILRNLTKPHPETYLAYRRRDLLAEIERLRPSVDIGLQIFRAQAEERLSNRTFATAALRESAIRQYMRENIAQQIRKIGEGAFSYQGGYVVFAGELRRLYNQLADKKSKEILDRLLEDINRTVTEAIKDISPLEKGYFERTNIISPARFGRLYEQIQLGLSNIRRRVDEQSNIGTIYTELFGTEQEALLNRIANIQTNITMKLREQRVIAANTLSVIETQINARKKILIQEENIKDVAKALEDYRAGESMENDRVKKILDEIVTYENYRLTISDQLQQLNQEITQGYWEQLQVIKEYITRLHETPSIFQKIERAIQGTTQLIEDIDLNINVSKTVENFQKDILAALQRAGLTKELARFLQHPAEEQLSSWRSENIRARIEATQSILQDIEKQLIINKNAQEQIKQADIAGRRERAQLQIRKTIPETYLGTPAPQMTRLQELQKEFAKIEKERITLYEYMRRKHKEPWPQRPDLPLLRRQLQGTISIEQQYTQRQREVEQNYEAIRWNANQIISQLSQQVSYYQNLVDTISDRIMPIADRKRIEKRLPVLQDKASKIWEEYGELIQQIRFYRETHEIPSFYDKTKHKYVPIPLVTTGLQAESDFERLTKEINELKWQLQVDDNKRKQLTRFILAKEHAERGIRAQQQRILAAEQQRKSTSYDITIALSENKKRQEELRARIAAAEIAESQYRANKEKLEKQYRDKIEAIETRRETIIDKMRAEEAREEQKKATEPLLPSRPNPFASLEELPLSETVPYMLSTQIEHDLIELKKQEKELRKQHNRLLNEKVKLEKELQKLLEQEIQLRASEWMERYWRGPEKEAYRELLINLDINNILQESKRLASRYNPAAAVGLYEAQQIEQAEIRRNFIVEQLNKAVTWYHTINNILAEGISDPKNRRILVEIRRKLELVIKNYTARLQQLDAEISKLELDKLLKEQIDQLRTAIWTFNIDVQDIQRKYWNIEAFRTQIANTYKLPWEIVTPANIMRGWIETRLGLLQNLRDTIAAQITSWQKEMSYPGLAPERYQELANVVTAWTQVLNDLELQIQNLIQETERLNLFDRLQQQFQQIQELYFQTQIDNNLRTLMNWAYQNIGAEYLPTSRFYVSNLDVRLRHLESIHSQYENIISNLHTMLMTDLALLSNVETIYGPNSPEAITLRETINYINAELQRFLFGLTDVQKELDQFALVKEGQQIIARAEVEYTLRRIAPHLFGYLSPEYQRQTNKEILTELAGLLYKEGSQAMRWAVMQALQGFIDPALLNNFTNEQKELLNRVLDLASQQSLWDIERFTAAIWNLPTGLEQALPSREEILRATGLEIWREGEVQLSNAIIDNTLALRENTEALNKNTSYNAQLSGQINAIGQNIGYSTIQWPNVFVEAFARKWGFMTGISPMP